MSGSPLASTPPTEPASRVPWRAFAWMAAGSCTICGLNALMRAMAMELEPMQAQFLRFLFGLLVMLPVILPDIWARGLGAWRPRSMSGQIWRGLAHTAALSLFFMTLPHLPLSDSTALSFTTPLWVMLGAAMVLRERVSVERWVAALIGFLGVLIVIGPHWNGGGGSLGWSLVMLAATPLFAASALITKALTRHESSGVIVAWQSIMVTVFSAPFAWWVWRSPTTSQWLVLLGCGLLGSIAHYCITRSFALANISAMQPVRFLDMVWACLYGLLLFGEWPTASALAGGAVIVAATAWIARRETRA